MDRRIWHFTLASLGGPCYSSPPRRTTYTNTARNEEDEEKEVLDEIFETPHNLASSLMNTTLLQQAVPNKVL
jgi:hypothetical protein